VEGLMLLLFGSRALTLYGLLPTLETMDTRTYIVLWFSDKIFLNFIGSIGRWQEMAIKILLKYAIRN